MTPKAASARQICKSAMNERSHRTPCLDTPCCASPFCSHCESDALNQTITGRANRGSRITFKPSKSGLTAPLAAGFSSFFTSPPPPSGFRTTGPALSPHCSLCLLCEPSHSGNLLDAKQRQSETAPLSFRAACTQVLSLTLHCKLALVCLSSLTCCRAEEEERLRLAGMANLDVFDIDHVNNL